VYNVSGSPSAGLTRNCVPLCRITMLLGLQQRWEDPQAGVS